MATDASSFFKEAQPAAILKHGILRRYLRVFIQKTGSTAKGRRVVYFDGYAGPGTYDDGTKGSPAWACEIADLVDHIDNLEAFFVEKDGDCFETLDEFVRARRPDWGVFHGEAQDYLPTVMALADEDDLPLFAFLDPFGLGVPFHSLRGVLDRTGKTELLLNFSIQGLRRNAGHLTSTSDDSVYVARTRPTLVAKVDEVLGGDYWRSIWAASERDRDDQIRAEYVRRLRAGGWSAFQVPVADYWQGPIDYYLVHVARHPDASWLFNESVSSALEEYRTVCLERSGQMELEPIEDRERVWIANIAANIARLLASGPFVVGERRTEVYGEALGFAREKHIRAAVRDLYERGETETRGVGDVQSMVVEQRRSPFQQGLL